MVNELAGILKTKNYLTFNVGELSRGYEMDENFWNEYYKNNDEPVYQVDATLRKEVRELKPGKAIDFGAGSGGDSLWLAQNGWDVTAVDFAPVAIERLEAIAKERNLKIKALVGDVTDFETKERFDLVYMCYLLLPEKERIAMFKTAARILRDGGTLLFIGLPGMEDMAEEFKDMFVDVDEVIRCIDNLTIEKAVRTEEFVQLPEGPKITDVVIIRAVKEINSD